MLFQAVGADFVFGLLIALSMVVGAALVGNIYTIGNCFVSLAFSQRKHLQRAVAKLDVVKSEGYLQVRTLALYEDTCDLTLLRSVCLKNRLFLFCCITL